MGIERAVVGILLRQGRGGKMVRKEREQKEGVTYGGTVLSVVGRQALWEMVVEQEAVRKMGEQEAARKIGGSEVEHNRMAVRMKSRMECSQMESDGLWAVMVSVGADDNYEGGVGHEQHVHSVKSNVCPIGVHDGVVGVPCVGVGTVAGERGMKEVGM
jgi:hypothetical protein